MTPIINNIRNIIRETSQRSLFFIAKIYIDIYLKIYYNMFIQIFLPRQI